MRMKVIDATRLLIRHMIDKKKSIGELIDEAPPLDMKPVDRATWEEMGILMEGRKHREGEYDLVNAYRCDNCGWQQYYRTPFCPFCGADMGYKQEET